MNIINTAYNILCKLKYGLTVELYNFLYIIMHKQHKVLPKVASIEQTIDKIVSDKCSVSRFGDGEVLLTNPDKNIRFQNGNKKLSERLIEVFTSNKAGHIICISDAFHKLYRFTRSARRFWRTHFFLLDSYWAKYLNKDKLYYNTFVTRPYIDFASKANCGQWFKELKRIWDGRDIVFIEGAKSRLGTGNNLFDNSKSIRRILCPPRNAFDKYDAIMSEALKMEKNVLFLIALGPTATVLAYDLHNAGYQAIDIGHIDIEYEWWRIGAKKKVKIEGKFVNEVAGGDTVTDSGDLKYQSEVIADVSSN